MTGRRRMQLSACAAPKFDLAWVCPDGGGRTWWGAAVLRVGRGVQSLERPAKEVSFPLNNAAHGCRLRTGGGQQDNDAASGRMSGWRSRRLSQSEGLPIHCDILPETGRKRGKPSFDAKPMPAKKPGLRWEDRARRRDNRYCLLLFLHAGGAWIQPNCPMVLCAPPAFSAASPAKYSLWSSPMSEPAMFWCLTHAIPWRISSRWTFWT